MIWKKWKSPMFRAVMAVVLVAVGISSAFLSVTPAQAHCDSAKGPVATAAHQALESGNVNLILPYVKPDAETELTAAFKEASAVRKTGRTAKQLADRYFIETAIRLHRAGEGAPFAGVTDEETPQAIVVADNAMANGSMTEIYTLLDEAIKKSVEDRYQVVVKTRTEAKELNTVEAHRERVEAELNFEKFIYELYTAASNNGVLTEGHAH